MTDPIDWTALPLGQMSDADVAKMVGRIRSRVWHARTELGIAPYSGDPSQVRYDWSTVDWLERDATIARQLGCSREAVRKMRARTVMR